MLYLGLGRMLSMTIGVFGFESFESSLSLESSWKTVRGGVRSPLVFLLRGLPGLLKVTLSGRSAFSFS